MEKEIGAENERLRAELARLKKLIGEHVMTIDQQADEIVRLKVHLDKGTRPKRAVRPKGKKTIRTEDGQYLNYPADLTNVEAAQQMRRFAERLEIEAREA